MEFRKTFQRTLDWDKTYPINVYIGDGTDNREDEFGGCSEEDELCLRMIWK